MTYATYQRSGGGSLSRASECSLTLDRLLDRETRTAKGKKWGEIGHKWLTGRIRSIYLRSSNSLLLGIKQDDLRGHTRPHFSGASIRTISAGTHDLTSPGHRAGRSRR